MPHYLEDYKPAKVLRNNVKLAGWNWKEEYGQAFDFTDTYNDIVLGKVSGASVQQADYRANSGLSTQVQTVQGKNVCPTAIGEWESGEYDAAHGSKSVNAQRIRLKRLIAILPSTEYHFNTFAGTQSYSFIARAYNGSGVFTRSIGVAVNGGTLSVAADEYFISITIYNVTSSTTQTWDNYIALFTNSTIKPFICLNSITDKSYAPFVPNSPSPEYQSPINNYCKGKNLLNVNSPYEAGYYDTAGVFHTSATYRCYACNVLPYNSYYRGGNANWAGILSYWNSNTFISAMNLGTGNKQFITPAGCNIVKVVLDVNSITGTEQIELGSTATDYEPFIPNAQAGTYKITTPDGIYEVTLDRALLGINGVSDKLVFDRLSKRGWRENRCAEKVFDGTESWAYSTQYTYPFIVYSGLAKSASILAMCSHFKHYDYGYASSGITYSCSSFQSSMLSFTLSKRDGNPFVDLASAKAWLAAQNTAGTPVKIQYQLAVPTRSALTFTKVASSTAPELPVEILNAELGPEYPREIYHADSNITSRNADNSKISSVALGEMRSLPNGVCDEWELGVKLGKIGKKVFDGTEAWQVLSSNCNAESNLYYLNQIQGGNTSTNLFCSHFIPSSVIVGASSVTNGIAGNPWGGAFYLRVRFSAGVTDITTLKAWLASEHAAGRPVTVYYELAVPVQTNIQNTLLTFPRRTIIEQTGLIKANFDCKVKVST